ncbi:MAG TPA: hypothetical protein PK691_04050 [Thermomicrobiales bacterium]|nr:hypothetical protein [Thermomicrobiales bacterium]
MITATSPTRITAIKTAATAKAMEAVATDATTALGQSILLTPVYRDATVAVSRALS